MTIDANDITCPHAVIRASAGSGKTYQLTTEYLRRLHTGASPQSILATTFTRKAAGEILGRVLTRLSAAARDEKETKQLGVDIGDTSLSIERCRELLSIISRSLHRVTVCTIDSFFHRMATSFRHELNIPANADVVDSFDPQIQHYRQLSIEQTIAGANVPVMLELLRRLHHDSAARTVSDAIDDIVGNFYHVYRMAPDKQLWSSLEVPQGELRDAYLDQAIDAFIAIDPEMPTNQWRTNYIKNRDAAVAGNWEQFLKVGLASKLLQGATTYYRRQFTDSIRAATQPLVDHARAYLLRIKKDQAEATYELFAQFDQFYTALRQENGLLLYDDVPHKLRTELIHRPDVMDDIHYRMDSSVAHLLLDEHQDTSIDQWQVMRPFASEITSHSDGSRVFVAVGDMKQAIYGWRGGCAEIFDSIDTDLQLPANAWRDMYQSWRTGQPILDTVNRLFADLGANTAFREPECEDDARQWSDMFEPHQAIHTNRPGYVELVTTPAPPDADEKESDDLTHEVFIADRIKSIADRAPGHTIGVLCRSNRVVNLMIHLLRARDLDASGEGGGSPGDDAAVQAVLSTLTMADHPGDSAAAFRVIESPMKKIVELDSIDIAHCDPCAASIRKRLIEEGYGAVMADWTRQLAPSCNERSVKRLTQLVELADSWDTSATLRPSHFVSFVDSAKVEDPTPSLIRVMTIHKAKGLEFDIAILPELDGGILEQSTDYYIDRDTPTGPVQAVYRGGNKLIRSLSPQLTKAWERERSSRLRDSLCTLYVAMTRPRYALHMFIRPLPPVRRSGQRASEKFSFGKILRRNLSDIENEQSGDQLTLHAHGDEQWMGKLDRPVVLAPPAATAIEIKLKQPSRKFAMGRRSWQRVSPSSLERGGHVSVSDLLAMEKTMPLQRGSLIHLWFEQIEWLPATDAHPLPTDDELMDIARKELAPLDENWAIEQLGSFKQMIEQPAVIGALTQPKLPKGESCELLRESNFAEFVNGQLIRGTFDRVVVFFKDRKPTSCELIDYKTDRVDQSNLSEVIANYKPQLETYRSALSIMLGLDMDVISASLLFVSPAAAHQISVVDELQ